MLSLAALALVVATFLVPAWLARGGGDARIAVVRNAQVARTLPVAGAGALWAFGAGGDVWPAFVAALSAGLGIWLSLAVQRSLAAYAPTDLHAFVAQRHGGTRSLGRCASLLTLAALVGMLAVEALAVTAWLASMLRWPRSAAHLVVAVLVAAAVIPAIGAGRASVLVASQWALGVVFLTMFTVATALLYSHVSALAPLTPQGSLALGAVALSCVALLVLRRSRYVDTHPMGSEALRGAGARLASRFAKVLNIVVSIAVALVLVFIGMELVAAGGGRIASDAAAALRSPMRVEGVALVALGVFPLLRPVVDVASWQQPAAVEAPARGAGRPAIDTTLLWLLISMLGAIAAMAGGPDATIGVVGTLLLILVSALALPSMAALIFGVVRTIDSAVAPSPSRRARFAAVGFALVAIAAPAVLEVDAASSRLLALFFAAGAPGLAVTPLVLSAALGRPAVSGAAALAVMGTATLAGAGAAMLHLATSDEAWLWAVAPACIAGGMLALALAQARSRRPQDGR